MRYNTRYRSASFYSSYFPNGVKWLLISNVVMFVLMDLAQNTSYGQFFNLLALVPRAVVFHFAIWQLGTYLFLHGGVLHLLFNMFTLWMFGITLEREWGTRRFLKYYFVCGIGAGLCDVGVNALLGNWSTSTIGASGAIYGLLLAFGVLFPDVTILFFFLFPIRARYFVMIYGALALYGALHVNTGVSNIAHLGGMAFGFVYLKMHFPALRLDDLRLWYRNYKLQRNKKKFQVYMRKRGSGRGPWVN
ncbi:MAG: rhomboid family intramembrane serine protease [Bryobacteraceae bacterium]|jgi:membrane associated rhomboid family serine protease